MADSKSEQLLARYIYLKVNKPNLNLKLLCSLGTSIDVKNICYFSYFLYINLYETSIYTQIF
jgi:hypothetical protein